MILDTEANLQGEFYHVAKLRGMRVVLELSTFSGRVDIAVINSAATRLCAVVECKRRSVYFDGGRSGQIMRYKRLGVPVYGLTDISRVQRLVETIERKHMETGVQLIDVAKRALYHGQRFRHVRGNPASPRSGVI